MKSGEYIVMVMTGGGCGSANIKVKNDYIEIEPANANYGSIVNDQMMNLTGFGGSAPALLKNFGNKLGLSANEIETLVKTGNARIVFSMPGEEIQLKKIDDAEAVNVLLKTGSYKKTEGNGETITLKLRENESTEANKTRINAMKYALNLYIEAVATIGFNKINESANVLILVGPLALGIERYVRQNPEEFNHKKLQDLIMGRILETQNPSAKNLIIENDFKVICDPSIKVESGSQGAYPIFDKETEVIGSEVRRNWVRVPIKALESINIS